MFKRFQIQPKQPIQPIPYQQPIELTSFSFNSQRQIVLNDSELNYYTPPPLESDLKQGFPENYIKRVQVKESLDALLKSLDSISYTPPDIITWRGIISKLMIAPYSASDSWEFNVTRIKNTLYIEEEQNVRDNESRYSNEELFTYFGYKFESLCTSFCIPGSNSHPSTSTTTDGTTDKVNTNIQYCSVFKSKIGNLSLILGGEVDCLYSQIPKKERSIKQTDYAELKTQRVLTNSKQIINFEKYKLLKIWAQSYLSGVPRVIIGFRDDQGILKQVKEYSTDGIWSFIKPKRYWNKHVCLNFTFEILSLLVSTIQQEHTVYSLKKNENFIELKFKSLNQEFIPKWFDPKP